MQQVGPIIEVIRGEGREIRETISCKLVVVNAIDKHKQVAIKTTICRDTLMRFFVFCMLYLTNEEYF